MLNCLSCCLGFFNGYERIQDKPEIPMTNTNSATPTDTKVKNSFVQFNKTTRIILIPNRKEYEKEKLTDDLWYNQSNYHDFKNEIVNKLKQQGSLSLSPTSIEQTLSSFDMEDSNETTNS